MLTNESIHRLAHATDLLGTDVIDVQSSGCAMNETAPTSMIVRLQSFSGCACRLRQGALVNAVQDERSHDIDQQAGYTLR